jgi:hypothetical protein
MYRFEPGSYQVPPGFLPAIACYKIDSEDFDHILVNVKFVFRKENQAVKKSTELLNKAFKKRLQTGNDKAVVESLILDGFKRVTDPRIAE